MKRELSPAEAAWLDAMHELRASAEFEPAQLVEEDAGLIERVVEAGERDRRISELSAAGPPG